MAPLGVAMRPYGSSLAAALSVLAGCGGGGFGTTPDAVPPPPSTLTYWQDIGPIVNDKCVKCHQTGGIGPFPLDNYDTVRLMAPTLVQVTKISYMPPYQLTHDG